MKINFNKDKSNSGDLITAYSYRFNPTLPFVQEDDHITAPVCAEYKDGYASISLFAPHKVSPGITISTECSFENIAAPLIVIAEDIKKDTDGTIRYDNYFEIVLHRSGVNVWRLWSENGKIVHKNMLRLVFPVETGKKHLLTVQVDEKSITFETNYIKATIPAPDMFPSFYAGITACEGICRFYNMTV